MSEEIKFNANIRKENVGHRINELRRAGRIPAVLYGPDVENVPVDVDEKEFKKIIATEHGENIIIRLKAGSNKAVPAIIKEIQTHTVTSKITHIDFCQINLKQELEVEVPIEVGGEAPGVKTDGGVLEQIIRSVKVKCLPTDIPDNFVLDVSELNIGDGLKISDLTVKKGVEILGDMDALVINIVSPTELKEPEEEEESEEGAEPAVIGKPAEESAEGTKDAAPSKKEESAEKE
jgi:large subunit ribosomal protein L25